MRKSELQLLIALEYISHGMVGRAENGFAYFVTLLAFLCRHDSRCQEYRKLSLFILVLLYVTYFHWDWGGNNRSNVETWSFCQRFYKTSSKTVQCGAERWIGELCGLPIWKEFELYYIWSKIKIICSLKYVYPKYNQSNAFNRLVLSSPMSWLHKYQKYHLLLTKC